MAYSGSGLLMAAELMSDTRLWSAEEQALFRDWVLSVYRPAVNEIRVHKNNWADWGRFGSLLAASYLNDTAEVTANVRLIKSDLSRKIVQTAENVGMYLPQAFYGPDLDRVDDTAVEKFVCLRLALFVERVERAFEPREKHLRGFWTNHCGQYVDSRSVNNVGQIFFAVARCQFQLSTVCRQLRMTAFYRIPKRARIFAVGQSGNDIYRAKKPS